MNKLWLEDGTNALFFGSKLWTVLKDDDVNDDDEKNVRRKWNNMLET